jgi:uncharacterized protein YdeI (YjbR/CyaY-like superfamily)
MEKFDPRIDAYIENSADFAKPILKYLRDLVHLASPNIVEDLKWGMPSFEYKGNVCSMASFKNHCSFGFWKGALLDDPAKILSNKDEAMGQLGRITSLADLPEDRILLEYIRNAVKLNEDGVKLPPKKANPRAELVVPDYFVRVLGEHPSAKANFEKFSYSHRKEYIEWITEAKTEETRQKRMAKAIDMLSEGKSRNWKYDAKK